MSAPGTPATDASAVDRLADLLADRALVGLSDAEKAELTRLAPIAGPHLARALHAPVGRSDYDLEGFSSFDLAAASADLAIFGEGAHAMPQRVKTALHLAADRFLAELNQETDSRSLPISDSSGRISPLPLNPRQSAWQSIAWFAAAASITLAAIAWWPRIAGRENTDLIQSDPRRIESLLASAADATRTDWAPWELKGEPPECRGVTGEVRWSDSAQAGIMKFTGLPTNNAADTQYQLWIIDATRGMEQRISGGVFSAAPGEVTVPISAPIHVNKAAAFAITIEKPGGTWVSDMKRRVVIASIK